MKEKISEYKKLLSNKQFLISAITALVFLGVALVINFYAGMYATEKASSSVTDVILSNTRAYDLDGVFVYGTFLMTFFIVFVGIYRPKRIPFVGKSVATFMIIRSAFVSMTHLGPFPTQIVIHSDLLSKLSFGGDLFFSGHTGMPFLVALIFWENKIVRNILLCFSIGFAVVVLLAHLHYTIDVMSAFFITYTIFHICELLYKKDRVLFYTGEVGATDIGNDSTFSISPFKKSVDRPTVAAEKKN
jgi:hypothetical protein